MKDILPDLNDQLIHIYESGLSSNKVTLFFAELPIEQAIFFSLIFLPFFLLAWLFLFKLFEIGKGSRKLLALGLVIFYFFSIGFLKVRGQEKLESEILKEKVTYYMMYNFVEIMPCDSVCIALEISTDNLKKMENHYAKVFTIMENELHLNDPKIKKLMNERMSLLQDYVINEVKDKKALALEDVNLESKEFGKVSSKIIQDIVDKTSDGIVMDKNKKFILAPGEEPPSQD